LIGKRGKNIDARSLCINGPTEAAGLMEAIGVNADGVRIMEPKANFRTILVKDLSTGAANVVKQQMLSLGGEAAVASGVVNCSVEYSDALLIGTEKQIRRLADSLAYQPFQLPELGKTLEKILEPPPKKLVCAGREMSLERPLVMGILNVTPDSFSDGGKFFGTETAVARAKEILEQGADIIDVGGESTRPGSAYVGEEEELRRVIPIIEAVAAGTAVSIDTRKSTVARKALEAGAAIVNDVSAGRDDPDVAGVAAEFGAAMVLMHMHGTPADMQKDPQYDDVVGEVRDLLAARAEWARSEGVESVVVDPGIGFGKTLEHNLELLRNIPALADLSYPVLIGHSRKSFIEKLLGLPLEERLAPSLAVAVEAVRRGASILRVHDVKETVEVLKLVETFSL
jgi:dihydropteroate synthase